MGIADDLTVGSCGGWSKVETEVVTGAVGSKRNPARVPPCMKNSRIGTIKWLVQVASIEETAQRAPFQEDLAGRKKFVALEQPFCFALLAVVSQQALHEVSR